MDSQNLTSPSPQADVPTTPGGFSGAAGERTDGSQCPEIGGESLKPCPLCGRSEFVKLKAFEGTCSSCGAGEWGRTVICDASGWDRGGKPDAHRGCGVSVGYCDTDGEAAAKWNRRTDSATGSDTKTPKPDDATEHDENKDAKATGAQQP